MKREKTNRTSRQVESDPTPSPDRSVLFEITPEVTQGGDHVADQNTDDDEVQGQAGYGCFLRFHCSWKNLEKST